MLLLLLLMMMMTCCSSTEWVWKPENASQHLGLNVTFNCSAGAGQGSVAWFKINGNDKVLLFTDTDSWNVNLTRRMHTVAMHEGGYSLTLTSLERSDDASYKCTIANTGLSHAVTLTVLGMSLCLSLVLCVSACFYRASAH